MGQNPIVPVHTTGLADVIYALHTYWVTIESPPQEVPNFGNGYYTADLLWYAHKGYQDGAATWDGGRKVGNGWNFDAVFPGPAGAIYAVERDGDLLWYDHLGFATGATRWVGPRQVGSGWHIRSLDPSPSTFLGAFCDTRNGGGLLAAASSQVVIYAVRADGGLLWYRHDGGGDGSPVWANGGRGIQVGSGWVADQHRVFSGCNGIVYLIGDDGTLKWYKHLGYLDGSQEWEGPNVVGSGWSGFVNVFSIGGGIIYAVDQDGTLWWYKHNGYKTGTSEWEERKSVGTGWNGNGFSVVANSVDLNPTFIH